MDKATIHFSKDFTFFFLSYFFPSYIAGYPHIPPPHFDPSYQYKSLKQAKQSNKLFPQGQKDNKKSNEH